MHVKGSKLHTAFKLDLSKATLIFGSYGGELVKTFFLTTKPTHGIELII